MGKVYVKFDTSRIIRGDSTDPRYPNWVNVWSLSLRPRRADGASPKLAEVELDIPFSSLSVPRLIEERRRSTVFSVMTAVFLQEDGREARRLTFTGAIITDVIPSVAADPLEGSFTVTVSFESFRSSDSTDVTAAF
jgi:hypothetical protein